MASTSIASVAAQAYSYLQPIGGITLTFVIFILVPLVLFRKTRRLAGLGLLLSSWIFGLITWLLGTAITFSVYGWIGVFIGMFIFGVGVVPIAIFASFASLRYSELGFTLIVMSVLVFVARFVGVALVAKGGARFTA